MHTSRIFIYQAPDSTYHWKQYRSDEWRDGHSALADGPWIAMSNESMPATLGTLFKYPYPLTAMNPDLPGKILETDKPAYRFHLGDPMFVTVTSRFLVPDAPVKVTDMKDETAFWSLRVRDTDGRQTFTQRKTDELNIGYPDLETRRARFAHDPYLVTQQVDKDHPYQRQIDLAKLYSFPKPGKYHVQLTYGDMAYDRDSGTVLGTLGFDVEVARR